MKILIVSQKYYPEPFSITSIAEMLVLRGHEVTVLCGIPNAPGGDYYNGYSIHLKRKENINGVSVIRALELPRKKNIFSRFLNYYSFAISGKKYAKKLDKDFDVVLVSGLSPIMMALPAVEYKKRNQAKLLMYETDLWPESLIAGGIKKEGLIYKHYRRLSAKIYKSMDEILVSSKPHIDYIRNLVHAELPMEWLPQFSDDDIASVQRKYENEACVCVFTGNIGKAQSLETLLDAAWILEHESISVSFVIAGNGSEKKNLESYKRNERISNVSFVDSLSGLAFDNLLQTASCGIVTLKNDSYCQMTLPRKVQTYMKAGLPVVSCAGEATDRMVREADCGLCASPENAQDLANAIKTFLNLPNDKKEEMSRNSIDFYEKHLTADIFMSVLEEKLKRLSK